MRILKRFQVPSDQINQIRELPSVTDRWIPVSQPCEAESFSLAMFESSVTIELGLSIFGPPCFCKCCVFQSSLFTSTWQTCFGRYSFIFHMETHNVTKTYFMLLTDLQKGIVNSAHHSQLSLDTLQLTTATGWEWVGNMHALPRIPRSQKAWLSCRSKSLKGFCRSSFKHFSGPRR